MDYEEVISKINVFKTPDFVFNEELHQYTMRDKKMTSVTTFIKRFEKPFDSHKHASKKAFEKGISEKEVLASWDQMRDDANVLGHDVHKFIELFLNNENPEKPYDLVQLKRIESWLDFYNQKLFKMKLIGQEIRIWSDKHPLAGTIDALFYYKNTIVIGDWKTNKKMTDDLDKHWNNLNFPFNEFKENSLNKYSLQVSCYQMILKEHGIDASKAFICWISPSGEVRMFNCKNFVKELENYLEAFPIKLF